MPLSVPPARRFVCTAASCLVPLLVISCASAPPRTVGGQPAVSRAPGATWSSSAEARAPLSTREHALATRGATIPAELAARLPGLSLEDVVDLALGNSPVTRTSWAQARAAAASYGAARGEYFPTISAEVTGGPARAISANPARLPANRTTVVPLIALQYLLWDFGARQGRSTAAREALHAADFAHNATVQSLILQTQQAYFAYQSARGVLDGALATVQTAQANLAAAERRREVGVATIADVLQARTARAQAELAAQAADGEMQGARAGLALAMGLQANVAFEVLPDTSPPPLRAVAEGVDSLIARAERDRPDLAAARALVRQGAAQVRIARSALLPSLALGSTAGRNFSNAQSLEGQTYALTLGVQLPMFSGLARQYDVVVARENAAAAAARAEQARLQAAAQVYSSYHLLRTAAQRVATSGNLLSSATQSEEVARGRYAEGVGSILDVLTAQDALADARAQAVQARWAWYAAVAQLSRDAGALAPGRATALPFTSDSTAGLPR